jgi:hypothetical protein
VIAGDRHRYQRQVACLLEQIAEQTHVRRVLEASGARAGALLGLERETQKTRWRLAELIAARPA